MNLLEIQNQVSDFVTQNGLQSDVNIRMLDFASEVGELSKEILKGSAYGTRAFEITDGLSGELGDTFFSLLCIANKTGMNLETCLSQVFLKYEERFAKNGSLNSGK